MFHTGCPRPIFHVRLTKELKADGKIRLEHPVQKLCKIFKKE